MTKILTQKAFTDLCSTGQIISNHGVYGPKVVLLPDGDYLKVFNPKSGVTKRRFFPKYKTFVRNTEKLRAYNISCVRVTEIYALPDQDGFAVRYVPLIGTDLRILAQRQVDKTLEKFIPFLVELHEKGIYFRGIHLANVLRLDDGKYGLIDVADLYFKRGPLSVMQRVRNLVHLLQNKDDAPFFEQYGVQSFLSLYAKEAKLFDIRRLWFNLVVKMKLR